MVVHTICYYNVTSSRLPVHLSCVNVWTYTSWVIGKLLMELDWCDFLYEISVSTLYVAFSVGQKPWQASGSCWTILQGWGWWGMLFPWIMHIWLKFTYAKLIALSIDNENNRGIQKKWTQTNRKFSFYKMESKILSHFFSGQLFEYYWLPRLPSRWFTNVAGLCDWISFLLLTVIVSLASKI